MTPLHPGDRVALLVPGSVAYLDAVHRMLTAGIVPIPLDPRLTASERERARLRDGIVVLDPPRAGAGKNVVSDLTNLAPRAIVYVACDPVALARDLGTFAERGYQLAGIEAFDLFPHSHHLETVALLQQA